MGVPIPAAAIIGSAVSTAVNGGTFASFAIGVGIGIAAGYIASPFGDSIKGFAAGFGGLKDVIGYTLEGALQGSIAGAISSAVYGQNIWKGMGEGALGGVIGAGVAISTATVLSFGKSVIDELMPSVVESIGKLAQAIGRAAIKAADVAINIAVVTAKLAVRLTIFPFQAAGALIGDIIYGPLEEGIAGIEDRGTGRLYCMLVKSFRFNTIIGYNWTPFAGETHLSAVDFRLTKGGFLDTLRHECGHGLQAWLSGPLYYVTVVPLTLPSNILRYNLGIYKSPIHIFEDDATSRAKILFFGQSPSGD